MKNIFLKFVVGAQILFRVLYLKIQILDFNAGQNLGMSQYEARLEFNNTKKKALDTDLSTVILAERNQQKESY